MVETVCALVGLTVLCMLSPGPDMVLVMRNTMAGGRNSGLVTSLGILTGNAVHVTYCAVGVGWLVARSVVVYGFLKYAGAAYLIYLGVSGLRSKHRAVGNFAGGNLRKPSRTEDDRRVFFQGLLNNLLNAKGALFYLGIFTQVIGPGTAPATTLVLILSMVATSALFWLAFVHTLHLPPVRNWLARFQRLIQRIFGTLLILAGLRVATSAE
ncbi:MAG: LysE family translocator [Myxococcales bacterium]|nr:LysE family translocator [Myxococcales bacterium]MDD9970080.1 LysE family translocator [Myxococcales bacterium]